MITHSLKLFAVFAKNVAFNLLFNGKYLLCRRYFFSSVTDKRIANDIGNIVISYFPVKEKSYSLLICGV